MKFPADLTLATLVSGLLLLADCGDKGGRKGAASSHSNVWPTNSPVLTQDSAIWLANEQARQRGWSQFQVAECEINNDHWVVRLRRLPEVFGGHATVLIPTNGGPVRYVPGK